MLTRKIIIADRLEICPVKDNLAYRIRKLRESKDYSQQNIADELGISISAYSKIERGVTDPSVGRIKGIAAILDVDITYFFADKPFISKVEDPKHYGFASKSDIEELINMINKMKIEIAALKTAQPAAPKKKKGAS